jgi:hypothetical protein
MKSPALNRKGRKRKSGKRTPSGALVRVHVDYQTLAANQPHRHWLPEAHRLSEKAGTVLGSLNITKRISDLEYEAGRRYGIVVGKYRSVSGGPHGLNGSGRGYDCPGLACLVSERFCECSDRKTRYFRALGCIAGNYRVEAIVSRVAVYDEQVTENQLEHLRLGLSSLAVHFGLTSHPKLAYSQNAH